MSLSSICTPIPKPLQPRPKLNLSQPAHKRAHPILPLTGSTRISVTRTKVKMNDDLDEVKTPLVKKVVRKKAKTGEKVRKKNLIVAKYHIKPKLRTPMLHSIVKTGSGFNLSPKNWQRKPKPTVDHWKMLHSRIQPQKESSFLQILNKMMKKPKKSTWLLSRGQMKSFDSGEYLEKNLAKPILTSKTKIINTMYNESFRDSFTNKPLNKFGNKSKNVKQNMSMDNRKPLTSQNSKRQFFRPIRSKMLSPELSLYPEQKTKNSTLYGTFKSSKVSFTKELKPKIQFSVQKENLDQDFSTYTISEEVEKAFTRSMYSNLNPKATLNFKEYLNEHKHAKNQRHKLNVQSLDFEERGYGAIMEKGKGRKILAKINSLFKK